MLLSAVVGMLCCYKQSMALRYVGTGSPPQLAVMAYAVFNMCVDQ
jgi:hypothetical protein